MANAYDHERNVAITAVRNASRVCRAIQRSMDPGTLQKRDRSPVTVADYASQALICRALLEAFPDDPVIGEEDASALRGPVHAAFVERIQSEIQRIIGGSSPEDVLAWIDRGGTTRTQPRFWTLDPVDGTKGFLRGEQYAVALALVEDGQVVVAVLGCPNLPPHVGDEGPAGTAFVAVRGGGAFSTPLVSEGTMRPISVAPTREPASMKLCESVESAHSAHGASAEVARILGITQAPLRLDSQAKYGVVARGEAEIYLRLPTRADYREKIWDHAAGALVVEEAGGTVTDITGAALDFTQGRELLANRGVVVSNDRIHDRLLAAIAQNAEFGKS
jgi:3'(2'), 5'-bisphosphate nucleotidase